MEEILRGILVSFFGVALVVFSVLTIVANFRHTRHGFVPFKVVKESTFYFLLTIVSICGLIISYDVNLWAGALVIFLLSLPLAGIRILLSYLSYGHLRRKENRKKIVSFLQSISDDSSSKQEK